MIRFILCVIIVVGFLILSIPILLVEWIIGKFNPMAKEISSLRIVQAVFRFILWVAGVKLTVIGEENVPLLSTWMKRLHCLFLDRKDIKQGLKTILAAIEKVKSGISICIFPEGTRSKNEDELDMLPFHEGSFKIATKTNCPIIPMAISGSADIWESHFPRIKKTHVILEYGKPIYVDQLEKEDKKHLGAYTQNIIHEMLVKNRAQL